MPNRTTLEAKEGVIEPDKAWEVLKGLLGEIGNDKHGKIKNMTNDRDIENAMVANFNDMSENLGMMAVMLKSLSETHPKVLVAFQDAMSMAFLHAFEYAVLFGAMDEDAVGDDKYLQMWKFPMDDRNNFAVCSWAISNCVENFAKQAFPVKTHVEGLQAMYNLLITLAATCARASSDECNVGIDWLDILGCDEYQERFKKGELVVDGVDVRDGVPGNKHIKELNKDEKK